MWKGIGEMGLGDPIGTVARRVNHATCKIPDADAFFGAFPVKYARVVTMTSPCLSRPLHPSSPVNEF